MQVQTPIVECPQLLPEDAVDPGHAVLSYAWSRRKKALQKLMHAKKLMLSALQDAEYASSNYREVIPRINYDEADLRSHFPRPPIPAAVLGVVHDLYELRSRTAEKVERCEAKLKKAGIRLERAREEFRKADTEFRQTAIELADVSAQWRSTARAIIVDQSDGKTNVFFGESFESHDSSLGYYIVYPNGAVYRARELKSHHSAA